MTIMGVTNSAAVITQSLGDMQVRLDELQRQLGTGERSNTYAGLDTQRGLVVGLQSQLDASKGFDNTMTKVETRMNLAQMSLTQIFQSLQDVKHAVVQPSFMLGMGGQTLDQGTALGQLDTILGALNVNDGSGYIFSGLNPNQTSVESMDHILNGYGTLAGFKQVMSERRQADVGANGMGRLVLPAVGAASIIGAGATLLPDAPAIVTGGQNISTLLSQGGQLVINGTAIAINPGDNAATIITAINAQTGATGVSAALNGTNNLVLTSANADTVIAIGGGSTASLLAELGVGAAVTNPTNLLTQGAVVGGDTLTITVGVNPMLTVNFGNGAGQVSTLAELQSALLGLAGGAASVNPNNGNVSITALNNTDTVTVGGTATGPNFGLGVLPVTALPVAGGTVVSLSEDAAGSPFGFKLAGVNSTLTGATVTGPVGVPARISINFLSNPNPGDVLTLTLALPDGTTEKITRTATTANPPGANEFTIGATPAATAANLQAVLTTAVTKLADTSLVAASAIAASNDFFNVDAANPPQRVNGPPFATATSLIAGTGANTVEWYMGEAGASPARSTANARIDPSITISYGMRANEQAILTAIKNIAVFAGMSFSPTNPNASAQYAAVSQRLAVNLAPAQGVQSISDIEEEIANAQIMSRDAQDRHKQASLTLTDFLQSIENISPDQIGVELLALQTSLQASLQTTAMLSKLSLVNYL